MALCISSRLRSFAHSRTHKRTHTKVSVALLPDGDGWWGAAHSRHLKKLLALLWERIEHCAIEGRPPSGPANWFGFVIEEENEGAAVRCFHCSRFQLGPTEPPCAAVARPRYNTHAQLPATLFNRSRWRHNGKSLSPLAATPPPPPAAPAPPPFKAAVTLMLPCCV